MTAARAIPVVSAICVLPAAYAVHRFAEAWGGAELDPAIVPPSPHIALFWRVGVAVVLALGAAGPLWRLAERSPAASMRLAEVNFVVAGALLVTQALFVP